MPANKVYKPTNYALGTVMQPDHVSSLRASFGEYEALGTKHSELTERIENLKEKMKLSRQRGAFQMLQDQMREVKNLVKEREDIDAKMAVADLARKKDDDRRLAMRQDTSYSEKLDSVGQRIAQLEFLMLSFAEIPEESLDFAMCQRPDGSRYGTRGKCEAPNRPVSSSASPQKELPPGFPKRRLTPEELKAYKAGGGGSKVEKSGITTNEVINQGRRNLSKKSGMARTESDARAMGQPLTPAERAAYKAGGGDAAARRNKGGVDEAIDQGRRNLSKKARNFSEPAEDEYDFARCQRPDGSFYGTRGKCKKGTEAGAAAPAQSAAPSGKRAKPSLQEIGAKVKEVSAVAKQARARLKEAEREARKVERETKGDNSVEARRKRIQASQAWGKAQRESDKIDRVHTKLSDMWHRENKRLARQKMSPEQRKAEREMDRTIRERG